MLRVVSSLLIFILSYIFSSYAFCKFNNIKYSFSMKCFIMIFLFSIINTYISINFDYLMKCISTNLLNYILFKILYKKNVTSTLVSVLFIYIIYVISELIFSILFIILLGNNLEEFISNIIGYLISNSIIFLIFLVVCSFKYTVKFINYIIVWFGKYRKIDVLFKIILAQLLCFTFLYPIIFNRNFINNISIFCMCLVGAIIFIFGYFKEKSDNNKLNIDYSNLLEYSKTYEDEVVSKGKQQHEYRNQLIVLDDMIPKTNKKAKEYIGKILNSTEKELDQGWLVKLKGLPTGGIKGLVHFKIKKMIDNGIEVYVDVDKKLCNKKKWVYNNNDLEDISKIIGVYLDNAIEAAINSKDKQIIIEFISENNNIIFKLSNTYDGVIDFQNIDNEKFSTKGNGRGYGLSLVKDIINKNNSLNQKREIDGKFFVQKLYIEIKK